MLLGTVDEDIALICLELFVKMVLDKLERKQSTQIF